MIELKNVTKRYGKYTAIDNISFKIEKGEVVGFLGQNGAGKTTTMKLITGLINPTEGEIYIDSSPISRKSRKKIGYMPENNPLYNELTVKEFINFMSELKGTKKQDREKEVQRIINELNLKDVQNKLIKNISRGYKQRVSLAGALVGDPEVLILDEPTVGLDPKQIVEIRNLITSLRENHTVLLSSHILSEVSQMCQKVIIIKEGKIIAIDTPKNLEDRLSQNSIIIKIEDPENRINNIQIKIKEIKEIKFRKDIDKNIKEYEVYVEKGKDIRKDLFDILQKEKITVLELKSSEQKLEDAFINLIDNEGGN